ncbi:BrnT family toxin [candidate division KSB1 bacterium]|nr:BrnT family toxin [bacterium]NUM65067.1 BrnT family toxin [candidate division KSB1 bacterium]
MQFEWDSGKAARNLRQHKVSFPEAATVLRDPVSLTFPDPDHSDTEARFIIIGTSARHRLLMVAPTERRDGIRNISARRLKPTERKAHEKEIESRFGR